VVETSKKGEEFEKVGEEHKGGDRDMAGGAAGPIAVDLEEREKSGNCQEWSWN